jgi:2-dehydro-3-deoxyphosphogluconate aldolase/(4S)-4-hydroxy-2-oxoglutarate aldolase
VSSTTTAGTVDRITAHGIVPVVTIADVMLAEPLFEALLAGGLPVIEVALRAAGAVGTVRRLAESYPDDLIGAGTVLTVEDAVSVIDAGAKFVVSPVTDSAVIRACRERCVAVVPGACTPTEIYTAREAGADLVKFFPAEPMGGQSLLQALSGPLPAVRFVPTGGINAANLAGYLALQNVAACGGSWMVPGAALAVQRYEEITALVAQAVATVQKVRSGA